jgi:plastocyanin
VFAAESFPDGPIRNGPACEGPAVTTHRNHLQRPLAVAGVLALLLTTAACGGSSDAQRSTTTQSMADVSVNTALLAFDPKDVRIKAGQTVGWVGGDNITHVLVQGTYDVGADGLRTKENDDKTFSLQLAKKGQQVSHTYDKAGTFTYFCTIHKGMNGTVVVS